MNLIKTLAAQVLAYGAAGFAYVMADDSAVEANQSVFILAASIMGIVIGSIILGTEDR